MQAYNKVRMYMGLFLSAREQDTLISFCHFLVVYIGFSHTFLMLKPK